MQKTSTILTICLLGLLLVIIGSSGCIKNTTANNTFGEKKISLDLLKFSNNTTANNFTWNDTYYYYVEGNILNYNPLDALDVKINATFLDANGSVVTTDETPHVYLESKTIPAKGMVYFSVDVPDPNQEIVDFKLKVVSAKAELYGS